MEAERKSTPAENTVRKFRAKRFLLLPAIILCIVILVMLFLVPAYISSEGGTNLIVSKINDSIDGEVTVGSLSMGWIKGVKISRLNFTDQTGNTIIDARQITAKPKYLPLLAGRVHLNNATIDEPVVSIRVAEQNTTDQQVGNSRPQQSGGTGQIPALPIENVNLIINKGNVKFETAGVEQAGKTLELRDINSKLAIRPLGKKSSLDVSMAVAGANDVSQITASGELKTSSGKWTLANSSGKLQIDVNELDLSQLGPLFTILKVDLEAKGLVTANIDAELKKGQFENIDSKVKVLKLDVSGQALKGDRIFTESFNADAKLSTDAKSINIESMNVKSDWLSADIEGTVPRDLDSIDDFLRYDSADTLSGKFDCDFAKAISQVKNISGFKKDFDIKYGRLSGDVATKIVSGKKIVQGKIKLWALEGTFPVKHIVISKPIELEAKLVSEKKGITVEKLLMDSYFANVVCSGSVEQMNYNADIDLEKMQYDMGQFFDFKQQLAGRGIVTGTGSWKDRVLTSSGNARLSDVIVKTPDGKVLTESEAKLDFDFKADAEKKLISVDSLKARAEAGDITVSNLIIPMKAGPVEEMNFNMLAKVDLAKTAPWATVLGGMDEDLQIAGVASSDLKISKSKDIFHIKTTQTSVKNLKVGYPGQEPFVQSEVMVSFDGMFDIANKIYDIKTLKIVSPQINVTGNLTNSQAGNDIKTQGNFRADYDLAAISTIIAPYVPSGFNITGQRSDNFVFSSNYPKNQPQQRMANLNARASFGFDSAKYMGIDIGKTSLDLRIDNGYLSIRPFTTTANKGRLSFGANANFADEPRLMKTPGAIKLFENIQINAETSDALLSYVNPVFADAVEVTGILNFDCEKLAIPLQGGHKNDIAVTGTLAISNMRLGASSLLAQIIQLTGVGKDPLITVMPTRFVLENGILGYDNMVMDIDGKKVSFSGSIWLDKRMKMNVELPWEVSGDNIVLPLKGTVNKPKIDTGKLLEQQFQKEAEKLIEKGLEELFK